MVTALKLVAVDAGAECPRKLACRAAEVYEELPGWDVVHGETMLGKPLGHSEYFFGRRPELGLELLGREPMVKVCRSRLVLVMDKLLQRLLLLRGTAQHHKDMFAGKTFGRRSLVVSGPDAAGSDAGECCRNHTQANKNGNASHALLSLVDRYRASYELWLREHQR